MALQLKNKAKEEKTESEKNKKGKYKRKRNVFGKRLTRFGLIGLIIGLVAVFAVVKVVFTLNQNAKQKKIDKKLDEVKALIEDTRRQLARKQESYDDVGKLIATLPTNFDRQATSLDLDRMVILSELTENDSSRSIKEVEKNACPLEYSIDTVKPILIEMVLYGELYNVNPILNFIDYLTDYNHENFYYIESIKVIEDTRVYNKNEIRIKMYTFYNDVTLQPVVPTETTTA